MTNNYSSEAAFFLCNVLIFRQEIRTMNNINLILIVLITGAIGIITYGILQYVQADYGLAVGKLMKRSQDIQNNPTVPDSIKSRVSASLNSISEQLLKQCERTSNFYPCWLEETWLMSMSKENIWHSLNDYDRFRLGQKREFYIVKNSMNTQSIPFLISFKKIMNIFQRYVNFRVKGLIVRQPKTLVCSGVLRPEIWSNIWNILASERRIEVHRRR